MHCLPDTGKCCLAGNHLAAVLAERYNTFTLLDFYTNYVAPAPTLFTAHCDIKETSDGCYGYTERLTANTELKLATGGPLGSREMNFWMISATATAYTNAEDTGGVPVPPEQIRIGSLGNLDTNGNLFVLLSDNDPLVITVTVMGAASIAGSVTAERFPILSTCVSDYPTNKARRTIGVGEQVVLSFNSDPPASARWSIPQTNAGGTLSSQIGRSTIFTAPGHAGTAIVTASSGTSSKAIMFTVLDPGGCIAEDWAAMGTL